MYMCNQVRVCEAQRHSVKSWLQGHGNLVIGNDSAAPLKGKFQGPLANGERCTIEGTGPTVIDLVSRSSNGGELQLTSDLLQKQSRL